MAKRDGSVKDVGYGRPPRTTQFKSGQSGNPKGRPKGAKNLASTIQSELDTRIFVTENGTRKKITKRQAIAKQLVNRAAAGDPKATPMLLKAAGPDENPSDAGHQADSVGSPEDALVIASIIRRIRLMDEPPSEPPATSDTPIESPPSPPSSLNTEILP